MTTAAPRPARRWPWAVLAVLAGAAAGAAVAVAGGRAGARQAVVVAPEQLLAVVDRPDESGPA